MLFDIVRLMPAEFIALVDRAPEWSLARTQDDLALYVRYVDDGPITMYLGPNKFWCSDLELSMFHFKLRSRILRARGTR